MSPALSRSVAPLRLCRGVLAACVWACVRIWRCERVAARCCGERLRSHGCHVAAALRGGVCPLTCVGHAAPCWCWCAHVYAWAWLRVWAAAEGVVQSTSPHSGPTARCHGCASLCDPLFQTMLTLSGLTPQSANESQWQLPPRAPAPTVFDSADPPCPVDPLPVPCHVELVLLLSTPVAGLAPVTTPPPLMPSTRGSAAAAHTARARLCVCRWSRRGRRSLAAPRSPTQHESFWFDWTPPGGLT